MHQVKNAIDYLKPKVIPSPLHNMLIVKVNKYEVKCIVPRLNFNPKIKGWTVLFSKSKHDNDEQNKKAAAALIH